MQDRDYVRPRKGLVLDTSGGTDQQNAGESDINRLVAQYRANGTLPHLSARTPLYGDFSSSVDLLDNLIRVREAQAAFEALPSAVRAAAGNDPVEFLAMAEDPEGREILIDAGLVFDDDQADPPPSVEGKGVDPETISRAEKNHPPQEPAEGEEGPV